MTDYVEEEEVRDQFQVVSTENLQMQTWLARQELDDREDDREDGCYAPEYVVEEYEPDEYGCDPTPEVYQWPSRLEWYKNTVYDDVEKARIHARMPSVFTRPTRYKSISKLDSNLRLTRNLGPGLSDINVGLDPTGQNGDSCESLWFPEIRHTRKSRSMTNYLHMRACVIEQIDFIKQRDNIWPDRKIYGAVAVLRKFIVAHNFRYTNIPDNQRQWLDDMFKRLDQWYLMHRPRKIAHLQRHRDKIRREARKEKLRQRCLRQINPPYHDWLQGELQRVDGMLATDRSHKRRRLGEKNRVRMDWIEGRTNRWQQRIRPDRRPKIPDLPPTHVSREPYYEKDHIKPVKMHNIPHKKLVDVAVGQATAKRMESSLGARDPKMSVHLDPETRRISSSVDKVARKSSAPVVEEEQVRKTSGSVAEERTRSQSSPQAVEVRPKEKSVVEKAEEAKPRTTHAQVDAKEEPKRRSQSANTPAPTTASPQTGAEPSKISKELADVLDLISTIEAQQKKLKSELSDLKRKKGEITGIPEPEPKEPNPPNSSPYRIGCRPVYLAPLPTKDALHQRHEDAHVVAASRHDYSLQERSKAIREKRDKHAVTKPEYEVKTKVKARRWDVQANRLLDDVYKGVGEAIDEYIEQLVKKEFVEDEESDGGDQVGEIIAEATGGEQTDDTEASAESA